MTATDFDPTQTRSWGALEGEARHSRDLRIADLLAKNPGRASAYSLSACGLFLDYSKHLVTDQVVKGLLDLVAESPLAAYREAMFRGEAINASEGRPVLHTALRASADTLHRDGLGALAESIAGQQQRMREFSDRIRAGQWLGSTGRPVTDIVNLGIGGSDLGPKMACAALKEFAQPGLNCHFVANVDGEVIHSLLNTLDPHTTLVIISSKTFTTQETLLNAAAAASWFRHHLGLANPYGSSHFIGVTAAPDNALKLGLAAEHLLEFWDWVGGRYSLWSAIGLAVAIAVGHHNFLRLLAGARAMDEHFRTAPWGENMPVVMALLGVWYHNFLNAESHGVVPYCERLGQFPPYLQQLDMESNGKGVSRTGRPLRWATGPIVWGQTGTNGQHSFFQLLHQGTHLVPVDFIAVVEDDLSPAEHHRVLLANMLAQSAVLMTGKGGDELPPWRQYPGNRPSSVLLLDRLTPESLGALVALYEHKVFVQGCLWNINSFDQWGVELGKALASELLGEAPGQGPLDPSTGMLLARLKLVKKAPGQRHE